MTRPARLFRQILRLYPRWYRRRFGDDAAATFTAAHERARRGGRRSLAGFWLRTVADVPRSALPVWWRTLRTGGVDSSEDGHGRRRLMGSWRADLQFVFRSMTRRPVTTIAIVLTLALGIGAVTTVFSLANWLLLRPVPGVDRESELALVTLQQEEGSGQYSFSNPLFESVRAAVTTMDLVAMQTISLHIAPAGAVAERVTAEVVSEGYAELLGLRLRGRMPAPDSRTEIAISDEGWRRWLGASPSAIGSTLNVNGTAFEVVGIMPPGFRGHSLSSGSLAWVPASAHAAAMPAHGAGILEDMQLTFWGRMLGRIPRSRSIAAVTAELEAVGPRVIEASPWKGMHLALETGVGVSPYLRDRIGSMLRLLMGVVGALLLLACANTANLALARAESRRSELLVRRAMGADSKGLVRHLLAESVATSLVGGAVAIGLSGAALRLIAEQRILGWLPPLGDIHLDGRVLAVSVAASVGAGLLFGIMPALVAARSDVASGLRESGRGSRRESSLGRVLVGLQIGISVVLLVGAGLLTRTLARITTVESGIDPRSVVQFTIDPGTQGYSDAESEALFRRIESALEASPSVVASGMVWLAPFGFGRAGAHLSVEGADPETEGVSASSNMASPGFFETVGNRVVAGRTFTQAELFRGRTGSGVIIINESLARALFGAEPPVGRTVVSRYEGSRRHEVIGVTADARIDNLREPAGPYVYMPIGQMFMPKQVTFEVKAAGSPADALRVIHEVVEAGAPGLPVFDVKTLEGAAAVRITDDRFMAVVSGIFGLIGLVLAAIGLYGVASQSVTRRMRELGIRLALGARAGQAMRVILVRMAVPALAGVAAGLLASALLSRVLRSRLFEMGPYDPQTWLSAVGVLVVVCAIASIVPARRALRVDPMTTLREE